MALIDVIIVSYNALYYLEKTINSFRKSNNDIIVVDNNSNDGSKEWLLKQDYLTTIIKDKNIGYGSAINEAAKKCFNPYVCIANCDIEVSSDWQKLINYFDINEKIACIGTKIIFPNGRLQNCGIVGTEKNRILRGWGQDDNGQYDDTIEVISVCGAFFIIKKSVFELLHGFDERFFLFFEETDLHLRIRKIGYKVIYHPITSVIHHWNKLSEENNNHFKKSQEFFNKKWKF